MKSIDVKSLIKGPPMLQLAVIFTVWAFFSSCEMNYVFGKRYETFQGCVLDKSGGQEFSVMKSGAAIIDCNEICENNISIKDYANALMGQYALRCDQPLFQF